MDLLLSSLWCPHNDVYTTRLELILNCLPTSTQIKKGQTTPSKSFSGPFFALFYGFLSLNRFSGRNIVELKIEEVSNRY